MKKKKTKTVRVSTTFSMQVNILQPQHSDLQNVAMGLEQYYFH